MRIDRGRLVDRDVQVRDASLFVLATEGELTERSYFEGLQVAGLLDNSRVKLLVLPTSDGKSSPEYVLQRLRDFKSKHRSLPTDSFWLVLDVDRWGPAKLSSVCKLALDDSCGLAISKPCFEVWLLLHFLADLSSLEQASSRACEDALRAVMGAYNKSNLDMSHFNSQNIECAVLRAESNCTNETDRWPTSTGSHVYRVLRQLSSQRMLRFELRPRESALEERSGRNPDSTNQSLIH